MYYRGLGCLSVTETTISEHMLDSSRGEFPPWQREVPTSLDPGCFAVWILAVWVGRTRRLPYGAPRSGLSSESGVKKSSDGKARECAAAEPPKSGPNHSLRPRFRRELTLVLNLSASCDFV